MKAAEAEGSSKTTAGLPLLLQPVHTCVHMHLCLLVCASVYTCKRNILHWPGGPPCIKHRWPLMGHQYPPPVSFKGTFQPPVGRQGQGKHPSFTDSETRPREP